jgi:hypothetical protein
MSYCCINIAIDCYLVARKDEKCKALPSPLDSNVAAVMIRL